MANPRSDSGLVLLYSGADEASVARSLREHDRDLRLVPPGIDLLGQPRPQRRGYRVARYVGSDRPVEFVCFWGDTLTGEPYQLSSGLLDLVKQLDKNTRGQALNADVANELKRQREQKEQAQRAKDLGDDWATREGRSALLPRGQSLRRARSKSGYHERKR